MNKTFYSIIGTSLLVLSNASFWHNETDWVSLTIEENIANILKDACAWKEKSEYLNCRLREPRNNNSENDIKLRSQIDDMRNKLNTWLSQLPYLPLEVRTDPIPANTRIQGNPPIVQSHVVPTFLPKNWRLKLGITWSIGIQYKTPVDWMSPSPTKQPHIPTPPDITNKTISMAWNE
jgi:hypothetical protein